MTEHQEMLRSLATIERVLVAENELPAECRDIICPGMNWRQPLDAIARNPGASGLMLEFDTYEDVLYVRIIAYGTTVLWRHRFSYRRKG